jgi:hypothetical protein
VIARCWAALTCAALVAVGVVAGAPSALAAESIAVSIAPSSPHVRDMLVVTATVSGASMLPPSLTVTRMDRSGTSMFTATPTGTAGDYSGNDPMPAVWGTLTYTVDDPTSGSQGHASTYVNRLPTNLTIAASRRVVVTGHRVTVTAHLGSVTSNRAVTIYARPYARDRRVIGSGPVDPTSGDRSATYTVSRRTRFIAHFGGDQTYRPKTVHVVVLARAVVREHLRHYYATSGRYRIYHPGDSPELDARLWPNQQHVCLYFRAQYHSGGSWHNASLSPCVRTNADGRAAALLNNALRLPYRLRAEWRGNVVALASRGPWLRLRFR